MRPPSQLPQPDFRATKGFIGRLVLLIFLAIAAFQSISFYVESLWYANLGFESVYWYRLRTQGAVFLVTGVATTLALWILIRLVTPPVANTRRPFLRVGQETIAM